MTQIDSIFNIQKLIMLELMLNKMCFFFQNIFTIASLRLDYRYLRLCSSRNMVSSRFNDSSLYKQSTWWLNHSHWHWINVDLATLPRTVHWQWNEEMKCLSWQKYQSNRIHWAPTIWPPSIWIDGRFFSLLFLMLSNYFVMDFND